MNMNYLDKFHSSPDENSEIRELSNNKLLSLKREVEDLAASPENEESGGYIFSDSSYDSSNNNEVSEEEIVLTSEQEDMKSTLARGQALSLTREGFKEFKKIKNEEHFPEPIDKDFVKNIPRKRRGPLDILNDFLLAALDGDKGRPLTKEEQKSLEKIFGEVVDFDWENETNSKLVEKKIKKGINDRFFRLIDTESKADVREMMGLMPHIGFDLDDDGIITKFDDTFLNLSLIASGLRVGDKIIEVDGFTNDIDQYYALFHGLLEVKLTVERDGDPFEVSLFPLDLSETMIRYKKMSDGTLYVALQAFHSRITERLQVVLAQERHSRLVLDLRGNLGGLAVEGYELSDVFLKDEVIATEEFMDGTVIEHVASESDLDYPADKPVIILTNSYSASASETVVDALKKHKRAVIVGSETYGKNFGQQGFVIGEDLGFFMSYVINKGERAGKRVKPDIEDSKISAGRFDEEMLVRLDELMEKQGFA